MFCQILGAGRPRKNNRSIFLLEAKTGALRVTSAMEGNDVMAIFDSRNISSELRPFQCRIEAVKLPIQRQFRLERQSTIFHAYTRLLREKTRILLQKRFIHLKRNHRIPELPYSFEGY